MKLYRINALLLKYYYITRNSIDRMFDILFWPIIGLIVFGFTTLYLEGISNIPAIFVFLVGGIMLWTIFERVQQDVVSYILEDFWSGNVANSFVTPVKESEIFIAVSLFGVIRSVFTFLIMLIIAFFAYKFNIFQGGLLSLVFVIPLFVFAWGVGLLVSGLIFKFGTRIQVFAWGITYLIQPIGAVFYPIETLPVFLQKLALFTPLVYIFEGFRMAYDLNFSYYHLSLAFGLALIYMIVGYFVFVKSIRNAKKTGLLTIY